MDLTLCSILLAVSITACGITDVPPSTNTPAVILPPSTTQETDMPEEEAMSSIQITVGNKNFSATLEKMMPQLLLCSY